MFEQIKDKISDLSVELGVSITLNWEVYVPTPNEAWVSTREYFMISTDKYKRIFLHNIKHILALTKADFIIENPEN